MTDDRYIIMGAATYGVWLFIGWVRNVVFTISYLITTIPQPEIQSIAVAVIGIVAPPVGAVHGWMLIFGYGFGQ
jgi:hypothetical protein